MKLALIGDTHGNTGSLVGTLNRVGAHKVQHAVVMGDFGLWTHTADGMEFLDETNEAAAVNNLSVYAIGGNHEHWDHWNWFCANMPTHKGFAMVRRRVLISPKVNYWTWDNRRFLGVGGAVSIDKDWRLEQEKRYGPKTLWWPNEQLSDDELAVVRDEKIDYLFTHDCSTRTPFLGRLKPDLDSVAHRQKIDVVLDRAKPDMHFHGHMHTRYAWRNRVADNTYLTETIGLECDEMYDNWGILDTGTGEFLWRGTEIALYDAPIGGAFL